MSDNPENDYALIDSGNGEKLERFGGYVLRRLVTRGGIGCNEFVFKKSTDDRS